MAGFGTCKRLALVVWSGLEERCERGWPGLCFASVSRKARSSTGRAEPAREAVPGYTWRIPSWATCRAHVPGPGGTCKSLRYGASSGEASDPGASTMRRTGLYCRPIIGTYCTWGAWLAEDSTPQKPCADEHFDQVKV